PARRRLRRPHPQGREANRPTGADSDQVRVGDQPQDREGSRPRPAGLGARTRRRGDRVAATLCTRLLHPLRSPNGTNATKTPCRISSAYRGKADSIQTPLFSLLMTQSDDSMISLAVLHNLGILMW